MEKIKYKEIKYDDFKDYKWNGVQDEERCTKFLFHGSRKGLIDEEPEKLEVFFKENNIFMSYLKENIYGILNEMGLNREEQYKKIRGLYRIDMYKECKSFEYGDFYLAANFLSAADFTRFKAGELCEVCCLCAKDIQKLGIVFKDDEINKLMGRIVERHEEYGETEAVILAVENTSFDDLCWDDGSKINVYDEESMEFVYDLEVSLYDRSNRNYRLNNPANYEFLLIHRADFLKFIPVFTSIKENEVDELNDPDNCIGYSYLFK